MAAPLSRKCPCLRHACVRQPTFLVFSNLKAWLTGVHHGVSAKHLQAYLNEFTFRFNPRFYPFNAFRSLLGIAVEADAPTFGALYSGEWRHPISSPSYSPRALIFRGSGAL